MPDNQVRKSSRHHFFQDENDSELNGMILMMASSRVILERGIHGVLKIKLKL